MRVERPKFLVFGLLVWLGFFSLTFREGLLLPFSTRVASYGVFAIAGILFSLWLRQANPGWRARAFVIGFLISAGMFVAGLMVRVSIFDLTGI